ncbi:MAG: hypothetical protein D6765_01475, partial [Bacteroidetes bacterium]
MSTAPSYAPLTQSQLLIWTGQELDPEAPHYNMALLWDIRGKVDAGAFSRAFRELVQSSDALRTVFEVREGLPAQRVLPEAPAPLERLELPDAGAVRSWALERCRQPFRLDLCCYDSALIRVSDQRWFWFLNQHHLITDAWGVAVLYHAQLERYRRLTCRSTNEPKPLPPFADYRRYEQRFRQSPTFAQTQSHWNSQAESLPPPPKLYGRSPRHARPAASRHSLDLGPDRSARLRTLLAEPDLHTLTPDLSLFTTFATLLFAFLAKTGAREDLSIGTPVHNRPTPAFKNTPGLFVEFFPLRAQVRAEDSLGALYQHVRSAYLEFLRHARPGASNPALHRSFNAVLNYIHAAFEPFDGLPTRSEWLHPGSVDPHHHLRLHVHDFDRQGSIQLHFDLNAEVFPEALRPEVPLHFLRLLDAFLEDRSRPLRSIGLLDFETWAEKTFPTPPPPPAPEKSLFQLPEFEGWAQDPALRCGDRQWTYGELEAFSRALAARLRALGVGAGQVVGVHLRRCLELPGVLYGVWRSGAAFLPLPADQPPGRLSTILQDARPAALIASAELAAALEPP